jgi:anti-sigma B factor antagonist
MNNLNITERHNQNVTVLDLAGNIRMGEDTIKLRTALRVLVKEGERNILLNLANISQIDSSGLGEMVSGYVSVRKSGGELKLLHLTDRVREIMVITKLVTVFESYENEAEAINSFEITSENIETTESAFVTAKLDKALISL